MVVQERILPGQVLLNAVSLLNLLVNCIQQFTNCSSETLVYFPALRGHERVPDRPEPPVRRHPLEEEAGAPECLEIV